MKIILFGNSPLPNENVNSRPAFGLRTWQFLKPLANNNHEILLITFDERNQSVPTKPIKTLGYKHYCLPNNSNISSKMRKIIKEFKPQACIAVNTRTSSIISEFLTKEKLNIPFWADLNGWLIAERQEQGYRQNNDNFLSHAWEMEKSILLRADKLSTVSSKQKCCLLGELASLGRLNSKTENYKFVHHIPNATEKFISDHISSKSPKLFRGKQISKDDIVIAWIGGYNTWVDEKLLFQSLEKSMKSNKKIHFVSTGGEIKLVSSESYKNFRKMIDKSKFHNRFHFLGWIPTKDVSKIYKESNMGINIDRDCLETYTGARNRLNEMLKLGLPIISTEGSEISEDIKKANVGIIIKRNVEAISQAILLLASNKYLCKKLSKEGKQFGEENYNYKKTTSKCLDWVKNPLSAPDHNYRLNMNRIKLVPAIFNYWKQNGIIATFKRITRRLKK